MDVAPGAVRREVTTLNRAPLNLVAQVATMPGDLPAKTV
jgi:hypothetical protein